jgi:hypothetical protein
VHMGIWVYEHGKGGGWIRWRREDKLWASDEHTQ